MTTLDCVSVSKSNCASFETWSPYKCLQCDAGFYPDNTTEDGSCSSVSTTIENCEIYDSATTCIQCATGTALTAD